MPQVPWSASVVEAHAVAALLYESFVHPLTILYSGTGSEIRQPLGYAMVGGLALSQLLPLYTSPVVYMYLDRLRRLVRPKPTSLPGSPSQAHGR
jgi:multidrug efflux pump subunit AcrB